MSFILHLVATPAHSRVPHTQEINEGKTRETHESEIPHKTLIFLSIRNFPTPSTLTLILLVMLTALLMENGGGSRS